MTTPSYPSHTADGDRFTRNDVVADAHNAARVRDEFATWLRACGDIDRVRFSDAVLAVNEALANTAAFAYLLKGGVGTIDVEAVRDGFTALAARIGVAGRLTARPRGDRRCPC